MTSLSACLADFGWLRSALLDLTSSFASERAGWLGDAHVGSETVLRNYDASGAYRLFLEMIAESLDSDGNPPDVVPFLGGHGGGGTPTWTAAFPIIGALLFEYGDEQIPELLYTPMQRFVECLLRGIPVSSSESFILPLYLDQFWTQNHHKIILDQSSAEVHYAKSETGSIYDGVYARTGMVGTKRRTEIVSALRTGEIGMHKTHL